MKTPYILCFSHIGYEFFTILKSTFHIAEKHLSRI